MTTEFRPTRLKQACTSFSSLVNITNVNQKYGLQSMVPQIFSGSTELLCFKVFKRTMLQKYINQNGRLKFNPVLALILL